MHATPVLVIGIITSPSNYRVRLAARKTWVTDAEARKHVTRFVIGRKGSHYNLRLKDEMNTYADFAVVESPDGNKGDSAEKVHRWFQYALIKWPFTSWIAKTEDDGILWPSALIKDLEGLTASSYYGVMRWMGACRNSLGQQCYSDSFAHKPVPFCHVKDKTHCNATKKCCEPACPGQVQFSPFACGPLDVRHRTFAQQIGACSAANAYFEMIRKTGGGMTDAAQGAAFMKCVKTINIADATDSRFAMGRCDSCSRCAKGQIVVHHTHFLKSGNLHIWNNSWRSLTRRNYNPSPLPEYTVNIRARVVRISRPRHITFEGDAQPYDPKWMQPGCYNHSFPIRRRRRLKMKFYNGCMSSANWNKIPS